jgi:hypothetical protein
MHFTINIACLAILLLLACISFAAPTVDHPIKARIAASEVRAPIMEIIAYRTKQRLRKLSE